MDEFDVEESGATLVNLVIVGLYLVVFGALIGAAIAVGKITFNWMVNL